MIVYRSSILHIKSSNPQNLKCPNCNNQGSMVLSVFKKHAHIFEIPLFFAGKNGFSECQHCKNVLTEKQMPEQVKNEFIILKSDASVPFWQYAGLFFIALLFFKEIIFQKKIESRI